MEVKDFINNKGFIRSHLFFCTGPATSNLPPDSHLILSAKVSVTTLSPLNADKNRQNYKNITAPSLVLAHSTQISEPYIPI